MIVVIADDLTGAGEIGGIGLSYGLKAEIQRQFCPDSGAQLLVLDSDTRSFSPQEARRVIGGLARRLNESNLPIEWIYKKTDSVLRGPIVSELEALQEVMGLERVLLVPANPSKGRVVCNRNYLIDGKPLGETDFANDPEYPARTSNVLELMASSESGQIHFLKSDQPFPGKGIVLGQAATAGDLLQWAERIDEQVMPAGAGEFFEVILKSKGFLKKKDMDKNECYLENQVLFVCGSSSDSSRRALHEAESLGMRVCRMPEELFKSVQSEGRFFQQWSDEIIGCFLNSRGVIMAIDREVVKNAEFAGKLRSMMAAMIEAVFEKIALKELFIEGGATASEIVDRMRWNRFEPCEQLGYGVVRMKVLESDNAFLTIKPGSYPWPESIWKFENGCV